MESANDVIYCTRDTQLKGKAIEVVYSGSNTKDTSYSFVIPILLIGGLLLYLAWRR